MIEREVFENALLGFLYEGPRHGYELSSHFAEGGDLAAVGRLGRSHLYGLLRCLEAEGCAVHSLQEGRGGPARTVFTITPAGTERLLAWLPRPVLSIRDLRVEFLLKLYFLRRLVLPGLPELLAAQRAVLKDRLAVLAAQREKGTGVAPWVLGLQERLVRTGIEWLSEWEDGGAFEDAADGARAAVAGN